MKRWFRPNHFVSYIYFCLGRLDQPTAYFPFWVSWAAFFASFSCRALASLVKQRSSTHRIYVESRRASDSSAVCHCCTSHGMSSASTSLSAVQPSARPCPWRSRRRPDLFAWPPGLGPRPAGCLASWKGHLLSGPALPPPRASWRRHGCSSQERPPGLQPPPWACRRLAVPGGGRLGNGGREGAREGGAAPLSVRTHQQRRQARQGACSQSRVSTRVVPLE